MMLRGSASGTGDAEEIARLSEDEKLARCATELIGALPDTKLEEPKDTDAEEVIREKLMLQVRFESRMFAVQKSFGEDAMKRVLAAAKGDGAIPAGLAGSAVLRRLKDKLNVCGLMEALGDAATESVPKPSQPAAPPKPSAPPSESKSAAQAPKPAAASPSGEANSAQEESGISTGASIGLVVAALALVAGVMIYQRRRAS